MSKDDLLKLIEEILHGIDKDQDGEDGGWWETSSGAEFGAGKLQEIRELFNKLKETAKE
jgi:hypothetical protein